MSNFIGTLQDKDGNSLFPINAEIVTNSNGTAIKFSNGIMICYKRRTLSGWAISTASGNLFTSGSISMGNFPVDFIEMPAVNISVENNAYTSNPIWWGRTNGTGTTGAGQIKLICAASLATSAVDVDLSYIAIGKWK